MREERKRKNRETCVVSSPSLFHRGAAEAPAAGFTLLETMIVVAMIGTLSAIAVPVYSNYLEKAKIARCVAEMRILEREVLVFTDEKGNLPVDLAQIGRGDLLDPWGNPYQYLNIAATNGVGQVRKDHNLHPLNSDYDLFSKGKDGRSSPPLTAQWSRDDIIRARDGGFIGLASQY